jgi:hypothetical protein
MRQLTRRRALSAVLAVCCSLIAACGGGSGGSSTASSGTKYSLVTPGQLTVAVYGNYPPYITVGADGKLSGVDGNLLEGFAQTQNLKLDVYQTTFASSILAVQQGKADMATYIYYSADRAKSVFYTLPFLSDSAMLFTKTDLAYAGPASMAKDSIGTVVGFVWAPYLQKLLGSNAKLFPDRASAGTALLNGQIQGYVDTATAALSPPLNSPLVAAHRLSKGDFGFPDTAIDTIAYNITSCHNRKLAQTYSDYVRGLKSSGKLSAIIGSAVAQAEGDAGVKLPDLTPSLDQPQQKC